jgi:hypothetical protein
MSCVRDFKGPIVELAETARRRAELNRPGCQAVVSAELGA